MQCMIYLRNSSSSLAREQIHDLADALHNLPQFIWLGLWSDAEYRRLYLEPYDRKWSHLPASPSLVDLLEQAICEMRK